MRTKNLVLCAVFTALIVLATLLRLPTIGTNGYIHLGNVVLFAACVILNRPYPIYVGVIGFCLADILNGYLYFVPITLVAKLTMTYILTKGPSLKNILLASVTNISVYYIGEVILYGSWILPLQAIVYNSIEIIVSIVIFLLLKEQIIKLKERID